jgi:hypothetical protein
MDNLSDIVSEIKNERCILIIGPDLVKFSENSFFETLCSELKKSGLIDSSSAQIFNNEELFLLPSHVKQVTVKNAYQRFYEAQHCYDEPFKKISLIPFHVILSFFPDKRLSEKFEEQNLEFETGYFPFSDAPMAVEKPSQKRPLIYNIFGGFDTKRKDYIITFNDMFNYLHNIMQNEILPINLAEKLLMAESFIFLGVKFDRWYVQLILWIITGYNKGESPDWGKQQRFTFQGSQYNNEDKIFLARRLDITFMDDDPLYFLDGLFQACANEKILKIPVVKAKSTIFISYSHHDIEIARLLKRELEAVGIQVIIDESNIRGGQKITDFIDSIQQSQHVIMIVSKNSLVSPWVSREIVYTLNKTDKHFIPCSIDKSYQEVGFANEVLGIIKNKIKEINEHISQRELYSSTDLIAKKTEFEECWANMPLILEELRKRHCTDLAHNKFHENIKGFISDIIS